MASKQPSVGDGRAQVHNLSKTTVVTGQPRRSPTTIVHSVYETRFPPSVIAANQSELHKHSTFDGGAGAIPKKRPEQQYDPSNYTSSQSYTEGSKSAKESDKETEYNGNIVMRIKYRDKDYREWFRPPNITQKASVKEYMKWKYFINSPSQIDKCNDNFCRDLSGISVSRDLLMVQYPYMGVKVLSEIAKDIVNYAVSVLGNVLSVEIVELNERSTREINECFGQEVAYVEEIKDKVYMVYPSIHRKEIEKHTKSFKILHEIDAELKPELIHFTTEITEKINDNYPQITAVFEERPGQLLCKLKSSSSQNVVDALGMLTSFEVQCNEVSFSTTVSLALQTFPVTHLINGSLKEKYPCCKAVQEKHIVKVYGLNTSQTELDKATLYVGSLIKEKEITLTGQVLRDNANEVVMNIKTVYKGSAFVTLENKCKLTVIGLRDTVEKIVRFLEDVRCGKAKLDAYQTKVENKHSSAGGFPVQTNNTFASKSQMGNDTQASMESKSHSPTVTDVKRTSVQQTLSQPETYSSDATIHINKNLPLPAGVTLQQEVNETDGQESTKASSKMNNKHFSKANEENALPVKGLTQEKMCDHGSESSKPNTDTHSPQLTTKFYYIRHTTKQNYFEKYDGLTNVSDSANFKVQLKLDKHVIELKGLDDNVKKAIRYLEKYMEALVCDTVEVSKDCISSNEDEALDQEAEKSHVLIEKKTRTTWNFGNIQITELDRINEVEWSSATKKMLMLSCCELNVTTAAVKFKLEQVDKRNNSRFTSKENDVFSLGIDVCTTTDQSECLDLMEIFRTALNKIAESDLDYSAFHLTAVAKWKFNDLARCAVDVFVKWLVMAQKGNHNKITLCVNDENELRQTHALIADALKTTIKSKCHVDSIRPVVVTGQLDQQVVDVLVNTTDYKLTHLYGNVSKALAKAAGSQLQQECVVKYPHGIGNREIAITSGCNLKCKNVFHFSLRSFETTKQVECYTDVEHVMRCCLEEASAMGHRSIAFPAIGTGNAGYPKDMVIAQMFTSVERFKADMFETSLERVLFVIYPADKDLFKDFTRIEREMLAHKTEPPKTFGMESTITMTITGEKKNVEQMKKFIEQLRIEFNKKTETKPKVEDVEHSHKPNEKSQVKDKTKLKKVGEYKMQNVLVTLWNDCILNAHVECIVNVTDKDLKHCEGISAEIAKAAGKTMIQECRKLIVENHGPFQVDTIVWTASGSLGFKKILHAVGPFGDRYKPFTTESLKRCKEDVKNTIRRCLHLANEFELTSIAFTSFSSGVSAVPVKICAEQYAAALLEFEGTKSTVTEVSFWDIDSEGLGVIHETFSVMISERGKSPWTDSCLLGNDGQSCENATNSYTRNESKNIVKNTARSRPQSQIQSADRKCICPAYFLNGRRLTLTFGPVYVVEIYSGNIFSCAGMECFVCQIGENGEPVGNIAQTLQTQCGKDYIKEISKLFKTQKFDIGDVVITKGGQSRFRWIIHTVVSRSSKDVSLMYRNIFKAICDEGVVSVALPLLGAGMLEVEH